MPSFFRHSRFYRICLLAALTAVSGGISPLSAQVAPTPQEGPADYLREIKNLIRDDVINEAIRRLENWLRDYPNDTTARRLICAAYEKAGDSFRLRYHARILVKELPRDPEVQAWLKKAESAIEKEYPKAVEELETALANDSENRNLRRELINLYLLGDRKDEAIREFQILLTKDPENPQLFLEYARNLAWMDRLEASILAYKRYLDTSEEAPAAIRLELARAYAWNAQYREAVSILNEILAEDPNNLGASVLLGDVFRWNDDSSAAERLYGFVLERDPAHPQALAGMRALEELERIRGMAAETLSIPEMERRVTKNPEDADAILQLARLYSAQNKYHTAGRTYERYFELKPDDLPTRRDYAFTLAMENRYDESIVQLNRYLEVFPEDIPARMDIVNMLMWSERYDQAERALLDMMEHSEFYPEIIWNLARIHHIRGNWNAAIHYYGQLHETAPQFHVVRAFVREIEENPTYKREKLEARVADNPEDIESRLTLALLYLEGKRYWEAKDHAEAILQIAPRNIEAERIVGWAQAGLQEMRFEQLREMRARLRTNPNDFDAALEIARILRLDQNYEDSARFYARYLQQFPNDTEVLEEYAMVLYWQPGREAQAEMHLAHVLELRPDDITLHLLFLELRSRNNRLDFDDYETIRAIEGELDDRLFLDPNNPQYYYWLGRLGQIRGNLYNALEFYLYADGLLPTDSELKPTIRERIIALENSAEFRINALADRTDRNPNDVGALLDLGFLQYEFERYADARETALQVLKIEPFNREARDLHRASDQIMQRVQAESLHSLRAEVMRNPRNLDAQLELARSLRQHGAYEQARERYRIYLRSYPSEIDVRREYAEMLSWTEEHREEAIDEMRQLAEFYPHDYEFQLQIARVMSWDRRYWRDAQERLQRLSVLQGDDPELLIIQADLLRYQGQISQARALYSRALELTGHTAAYHSQRYEEAPPPASNRNERRSNSNESEAPLPPINAFLSERELSVEKPQSSASTNKEGPIPAVWVDPYTASGSRSGTRKTETPRREYLPPLYFRDPAIYEETRSLEGAPEDSSLPTSRMLAQYTPVATNSNGTRAEDRRWESDSAGSFRTGSRARVEGRQLPAGSADEVTIVPTRNGQLRPQAQAERDSQPGMRPRRLSEVTSLVEDNPHIPPVVRPDLNPGSRTGDPLSFRRRAPSSEDFTAPPAPRPEMRSIGRDDPQRPSGSRYRPTGYDDGFPAQLRDYRPPTAAPPVSSGEWSRSRDPRDFEAPMVQRETPTRPQAIDRRENFSPYEPRYVEPRYVEPRYVEPRYTPDEDRRFQPSTDRDFASQSTALRQSSLQPPQRYSPQRAPETSTMLAAPMREDSRLYSRQEPLMPSRELRATVPPPPRMEEQMAPRPRVQAPRPETMDSFRQTGDNRSSGGRVLAPPPAATGADGDFATRAESGIRSIEDQLRPTLALLFGFEADSDDFSGRRLGARYSHYLNTGTRWDLGLTYFRYTEDTGLSANKNASAAMLSLGVSAPLSQDLSGSAKINLTKFSIGPGLTVTGGVGMNYTVDPINTVSLDYEHYDAIHEVKTVRSLEEEISADRIRLAWNSRPTGYVTDGGFTDRLFFEGNLSYASFSDSNTETAFLLRPYYRILDDPALDFVVGWRSLSYQFESPFYWSPGSYSGPLFGLRIAGDTIWQMQYDIRGEISFPSDATTSRSLSFDLRKNISESFSVGGNLFLTQSPRQDDEDYSYHGFLFDLLYRF